MQQHQGQPKKLMSISTNNPIQFIKAFRELNSNENPEFKERKQKEAELLAEFVTGQGQATIKDLATKNDLKELKLDIEELRFDIENLKLTNKRDIEEVRLDIENLKLANKSDIEELRNATKKDTEMSKLELEKTIYKNSLSVVGIVSGINAFIAGILFFLLKFTL